MMYIYILIFTISIFKSTRIERSQAAQTKYVMLKNLLQLAPTALLLQKRHCVIFACMQNKCV